MYWYILINISHINIFFLNYVEIAITIKNLSRKHLSTKNLHTHVWTNTTHTYMYIPHRNSI